MFATRHAIKMQTTRLVGRQNGVRGAPWQGMSMVQSMRFMGQQERNVWNTSLKRTVTLAAVGSVGLMGIVILGPFILVGIGGLGAVLAFRFWRFKRQFESGRGNDNWSGFVQGVFERQQQVFGKEKRKVEGEALGKLKQWTETEQGRDWLIQHGMHPQRMIENVSMRGSSFKLVDGSKNIKIELDLGQSGSVLIAVAEMDVEGNVSLTDIKLMTMTGERIRIPLQQNGGGRVIEGEFHDV
ncbi:uncharacterized protein EV154DRAFT_565390 [Mucor mucedo]|uniref:uncharacterized protein n=1 Tax=Mucor mucedo TaxID=29922 RepID=UPI002220C2A2|nr:uncharacterized protein EV154DRAFT_565390 [Mucor mucedo]KAI7889426.1 hypothetical protein EV154DRAFT_565390 [Mucor mucedo]